VLPSAQLNPLHPLPHSAIYHFDAPWIVTVFVAAMALVSFSYLVGFWTRTSGAVLWFGAYLLFHRNQLTLNPSLPFLGFWFLAQCFMPANPPRSIDRWLAQRNGGAVHPASERMPRRLLAVLWVVMSIAYTASGVTKLFSPSWVDGNAIRFILGSPLARDTTLVHVLEATPRGFTAMLTWGALLAELLFAPLALSRRARPWAWASMVALHAGLIVVMNIADISIAMIAFHLVTFDPEWLGTRRGEDDGEGREPAPLRRIPLVHR
jgi:hypothetical protein